MSGLIHRVLRSPALRLAALAAVIGAWAWFLRGQLDALRVAELHVAPAALAASAVLGAVYFAGLAVSWTLLLRSMGGAAGGVPVAAGAAVWAATMLSRYLPGNLWHIVGRVAFAGRLGVARAQVVASATVEQLLTLLGALATAALCLPFWRGATDGLLWALGLLPAGLILLHPRLLGAALGVAARRLGRPELAWPYGYATMLLLAGAYALANLAAGLALLAILAPLTPLEPGAAAYAVGAAGAAWAAGYLSLLTPSGLGVREAVLTALLAQVVPLPVAVAASLLHRLAMTLGEAVAAGALLLWRRL